MVMMCLAHFPWFWNTILALLLNNWLLMVLLLIIYDVLIHHIMILKWIIYDYYFYYVSRHILFLSLFLTSHDWLIMVYTTLNNLYIFHLLSVVSQVGIIYLPITCIGLHLLIGYFSYYTYLYHMISFLLQV